MADQCLFDFLHMEIVSHVYKEQQTNKGEVDNKVRCYYIVVLCNVRHTIPKRLFWHVGFRHNCLLLFNSWNVLSPGESCWYFCPREHGFQGGTRTHWEVWCPCYEMHSSFQFRDWLHFLPRITRDSPSFKDELDIMKFICKDFWTKVFRRQVDNLRTNHQVKQIRFYN